MKVEIGSATIVIPPDPDDEWGEGGTIVCDTYGFERGIVGSISPTYVTALDESDEIPITSLWSIPDNPKYQISLSLNKSGFGYIGNFYLGRADTMTWFGENTSEESSIQFASYKWENVVGSLFTREDVGKTIPIWLSSTAQENRPSWSY